MVLHTKYKLKNFFQTLRVYYISCSNHFFFYRWTSNARNQA